MDSFSQLGLPQSLTALQTALRSMGFERPTPIQAQAIPLALHGADLLACAQTGTGKTAAFGIPLVARLAAAIAPNASEPAARTQSGAGGSALVLVPTRELALQVEGVLASLCRGTPGLRTAALIGGVSIQGQRRELAAGKPRILIATPGRLIDHLGGGSLSLATVRILVLDEADRMLDMGFAPQLRRIFKHLPVERQTLLFSATMPPEIEKLALGIMRNPRRVSVGAVSRPVEKIEQSVVETTPREKNELLLDVLNERQGSVIIFARTQVRTDRLARFLGEYGHKVARIHGGRTQGQRKTAVHGFKDGRFRILVATDIAARGIDIPEIAHVINYDLPMVPEDYVHRIGRTGRAGAGGQALSLVTPEERSQWKAISRLLVKQPR
jgi:ATP-dependent RNA helicase RhlE